MSQAWYHKGAKNHVNRYDEDIETRENQKYTEKQEMWLRAAENTKMVNKLCVDIGINRWYKNDTGRKGCIGLTKSGMPMIRRIIIEDGVEYDLCDDISTISLCNKLFSMNREDVKCQVTRTMTAQEYAGYLKERKRKNAED